MLNPVEWQRIRDGEGHRHGYLGEPILFYAVESIIEISFRSGTSESDKC